MSQGILVSKRNTMSSLLVSKMGKLQIAIVSADVDISDVEAAVIVFGLCLVMENPLRPTTICTRELG